MTTYVVLLRGVNVGGRNRLPMADLRAALTADGMTGVQTYIQSGNVVLQSSARSTDAVAARVRGVIARDFGLDVPAVVLTAAELESVAAANPYPDEADPTRLHAIVHEAVLPAEAVAEAAARQQTSSEKGSRDTVTVVGRVAYLHTPEGFGRSDLAGRLTTGRSAPLRDGTARNWATVAALIDLCSH